MKGAVTLAVALAGVLLVTWPVAVHPVAQVLGAPELEATDHLWALWAGLRDGPLVIHTQAVGFPEGARWVLGDPLSLLPFSVGWLAGGAALGFNLVQVCYLLLAALGAVLMSREVLGEDAGPDWLTALIAVLAPPLAAGLVTGMSDAQGVGLVLVALALLHRSLARPSWSLALGTGLAFGACAWAGPYLAIQAALLAPVVLLLRLRTGRQLAGVALSSLVGLAVAWPVVSSLSQRASDLPGSTSLAPLVLARPDAVENRVLGADLLRMVLPLGAPGGLEVHAVYLGLGALTLAALGVWRLWGGRVTLLLGAALWSAVLAGGLYLQAGGVVHLGARVLLMPAGWLTAWVPALGRAARWYRFAMPAALLLAPLAGAGGGWILRRLGWLALAPVVTLVIVDALWLAPLGWPREVYDAAPPQGYALLDTPGALLELPPVRYASRVASSPRLRHPALLWQTTHGHDIAGDPLVATSTRSAPLAGEWDARVRRGGGLGDLRQRSRDQGFTWIIHHPDGGETALLGALGAPEVQTDALWAWRL